MSEAVEMKRRAFLRDAGRSLLAALLLLGAGALVTRRPSERCTADGICRTCAGIEGCGLPAALSYKQARGK